MEEKTKKYLLYGGLAVGGLYLYTKWKKGEHEPKKAKSTPASSLAPPTPQGLPYQPSGLPGAGYQPYVPPYQPPYYPPQYPGQYPGVPPIGYPSYPGQYPGYPTPGYPSYPPPYVPGAGLPPSVIGLGWLAARQQLQAAGYFVVATINGRTQNTGPVPPNIPIAYVDVYGGVVRGVRYSNQQAYPSVNPSPYGGTY